MTEDDFLMYSIVGIVIIILLICIASLLTSECIKYKTEIKNEIEVIDIEDEYEYEEI